MGGQQMVQSRGSDVPMGDAMGQRYGKSKRYGRQPDFDFATGNRVRFY